MNQFTLSQLNLGKSLDSLANLDPRGYGVCNLLYQGSYNFVNSPLSMNSAIKLNNALEAGDVVYILTGFVLHPYNKAETDGIIGAMLLAKALSSAFKVKPLIVCPEEAYKAVQKITKVIKLKFMPEIEGFLSKPNSLCGVIFTKDLDKAKAQAETLIEKVMPKAVISIECPGANAKGVYHNATGLDVTNLQAKQDVLFEMLIQKGVLNVAIGDLGNEIGLGSIADTLNEKIPYASKGSCRCGCGGGIAVKTKTDNLITATISDWGAYALISAISYLVRDYKIMHDEKLENKVIKTAVKNGLIDMYGKHIFKIDGIGLDIHMPIVKLMRELVKSTIAHENITKTWFEKVIQKI